MRNYARQVRKAVCWMRVGSCFLLLAYAQQSRDLVLASLGAPYAFSEYPDAKVCFCTYSDVPVSQQALAESLLEPPR